ncbi:FAD-dependent oxidoreductase [Longispora albida]|uniref:FAD-dependent oxidoreductase n=1 Tax=Longispora albida TaxID=203523 RepID=UPI000364FE2C|nr:FAD-dependent monooxygenase [Longispora albida]
MISSALIIGGGIAGPVTAMALQQAGIAATVFEAYGGRADGVGGALNIAPNGINALRLLGADGVVAEAGFPTARMVMQNANGKVLGDMAALPGLPIGQTVARADLYAALMAEAERRGIDVRYGKRFVSAVEGAGGVTATFADGTSASGDILVGADGIRSAVRAVIDPGAPGPRYTGLLGFGGWVPDSELASTKDAMHFVFGRKAFFGYQVLDNGLAGWFANLPRKQPLSGPEARAIPAAEWLGTLRELYRGDDSPAVHLLNKQRPEDLVTTGAMEDIPTVPVWHRGRMVLVGDSAHATSPSSGQGASLAVESAVELARCLRDLGDHGRAFAAYEGLRRARAEKVIRNAERVNNDKAAGPVGRVIRDLMFPLAMRTFYSPEKMFGWLHRHEIPWEQPVRAA